MGSLATLDVLNVSLESINGATWIVENVEKKHYEPQSYHNKCSRGVHLNGFLGAETVETRTSQVCIFFALLSSMTAYIR